MRTRHGTGIDQGMVWERPRVAPGVVVGIIVFVSGCVTMIIAGVGLILLGPQG